MDKASCELGGPSLSSAEEEVALSSSPVLMDGEIGGHVVIEEDIGDESGDKEQGFGIRTEWSEIHRNSPISLSDDRIFYSVKSHNLEEEEVGEGENEEEIDDKNGDEKAAVGKEEDEDDDEEDEELRERLEDESGDEEEEPTKVTDDAPRAGSSRNGIRLVPEPYVPQGEFLGPARFASVGTTTAGFMRVAVVEAEPGSGQEIVVLYRYTRFSRTCMERA
ncbi:hypothetical protein GUJ93_ZPchr0006g46054 [Zizania palustris]|uniref:Uncharacterized protein n=1 Tax=Zizania palustris TaxID=103762 RepID=A0A8J5T0N8_ZIZPA|nr:hypothetical protein GUJ93_ZPchr0006g46054 [Zizania palustris]